eukprot:514047-Rhodomonas_salina.2
MNCRSNSSRQGKTLRGRSATSRRVSCSRATRTILTLRKPSKCVVCVCVCVCVCVFCACACAHRCPLRKCHARVEDRTCSPWHSRAQPHAHGHGLLSRAHIDSRSACHRGMDCYYSHPVAVCDEQKRQQQELQLKQEQQPTEEQQGGGGEAAPSSLMVAQIQPATTQYDARCELVARCTCA